MAVPCGPETRGHGQSAGSPCVRSLASPNCSAAVSHAGGLHAFAVVLACFVRPTLGGKGGEGVVVYFISNTTELLCPLFAKKALFMFDVCRAAA
jgi:hypothetical protein